MFANSASCRRLLIAEDDIAIAHQLAEYLEVFDYQVDLAADGSDALDKASSTAYGVVLADHKMPGWNGLEVLRSLSVNAPDTSVVLMTGYPSLDLIVAALRLGVCDIVIKPFSLGELDRTIGSALHRHRAALAYREMARKLNLEDEVPSLRATSAKNHTDGRSSLPKDSNGSMLPEEQPVR